MCMRLRRAATMPRRCCSRLTLRRPQARKEEAATNILLRREPSTSEGASVSYTRSPRRLPWSGIPRLLRTPEASWRHTYRSPAPRGLPRFATTASVPNYPGQHGAAALEPRVSLGWAGFNPLGHADRAIMHITSLDVLHLRSSLREANCQRFFALRRFTDPRNAPSPNLPSSPREHLTQTPWCLQ